MGRVGDGVEKERVIRQRGPEGKRALAGVSSTVVPRRAAVVCGRVEPGRSAWKAQAAGRADICRDRTFETGSFPR